MAKAATTKAAKDIAGYLGVMYAPKVYTAGMVQKACESLGFDPNNLVELKNNADKISTYLDNYSQASDKVTDVNELQKIQSLRDDILLLASKNAKIMLDGSWDGQINNFNPSPIMDALIFRYLQMEGKRNFAPVDNDTGQLQIRVNTSETVNGKKVNKFENFPAKIENGELVQAVPSEQVSYTQLSDEEKEKFCERSWSKEQLISDLADAIRDRSGIVKELKTAAKKPAKKAAKR